MPPVPIPGEVRPAKGFRRDRSKVVLICCVPILERTAHIALSFPQFYSQIFRSHAENSIDINQATV